MTFDIEEFDELPVSIEEQFKVSYRGTLKILELIKKWNIKSTFFITANFAKRYPLLIKQISKKHEIALHGYSHSDVYSKMTYEEIEKRLSKAKEIIEKIINKKIRGFRAQRLQKIDFEILKKLRIKYDSSLHPTFIPWKYNNFFSKRKIHCIKGVKEIPLSVTPILRFPIFWFAFRNMPLIYSKICFKLCSINMGYVLLLFHPWEFVDLSKYNLPLYMKRNTGDKLIKKLNKFIIKFKKYEFDKLENLD